MTEIEFENRLDFSRLYWVLPLMNGQGRLRKINEFYLNEINNEPVQIIYKVRPPILDGNVDQSF